MKSYREYYDEEFSRSLDEGELVYGFKDGEFFYIDCDDEEEFRRTIERLKKQNIPYNQVKPNK